MGLPKDIYSCDTDEISVNIISEIDIKGNISGLFG